MDTWPETETVVAEIEHVSIASLLTDVSVRFKRGEISALLGGAPEGTLLLNLLARRELPGTGKIFVAHAPSQRFMQLGGTRAIITSDDWKWLPCPNLSNQDIVSTAVYCAAEVQEPQLLLLDLRRLFPRPADREKSLRSAILARDTFRTTVVFTTDQPEQARLADQVITLESGRVVYDQPAYRA